MLSTDAVQCPLVCPPPQEKSASLACILRKPSCLPDSPILARLSAISEYT
ncbi:hypothetical protein DJFAAGMI_01692 [Comamonas sp. PE63]|uniref:Uncharacterized protein n=1 Tax=Comamonas brasiliensis TaxID=1812482 RepID=A0ABS5LR29_9BURK|nr:hypothetical protein [Comamonas sp. PE63]